jgi:hypothetical protein
MHDAHIYVNIDIDNIDVDVDAAIDLQCRYGDRARYQSTDGKIDRSIDR